MNEELEIIENLRTTCRDIDETYEQEIKELKEELKQIKIQKRLLCEAFNEIYHIKSFDSGMSYEELQESVGRLNNRIRYLEKDEQEIKELKEIITELKEVIKDKEYVIENYDKKVKELEETNFSKNKLIKEVMQESGEWKTLKIAGDKYGAQMRRDMLKLQNQIINQDQERLAEGKKIIP